jgi:hypothetical protein
MKKPEKPSRVLAMLAKCHDCMGGYYDGIKDCRNHQCPLYSWMPRRAGCPDLTWLEYNPRKKGKVKWEDCGREMTEEEKQVARDRLANIRELKKLEKELEL